MIQLYHVPLTRSLRVRWLLEELEVPYALETVSLDDLETPALLALNPFARVPILVDGALDIPGDAAHFTDSVHFTDAGSRAMAQRVSTALMAAEPFQALVAARAER